MSYHPEEMFDIPDLNLQLRTGIEIVLLIWKNNDALELPDFTLFKRKNNKNKLLDRELFQILSESIHKELLKLPLPPLLKDGLAQLIMPIGIQIIKWKESQQRISREKEFLRQSIENIILTENGTLDAKRSVERLIDSGSLSIILQYKLVCHYCLENHARALWEKLPTYKKNFFQNKHIFDSVTHFMTMIIKENISLYHCHVIRVAIVEGNVKAVEFFWDKHSNDEKKSNLSTYLHLFAGRYSEIREKEDFYLVKGFYSDVGVFLLSKADEETMKEVMSYAETRRMLLKICLKWPFQRLFLKFVRDYQEFITQHDFFELIIDICTINQAGFRDYDYSFFIKELWKLFKKFQDFTDVNIFCILEYFIRTGDEDGVGLMLDNTTHEIKEKLIFHFYGRELCEMLVVKGNWNMLNLFITKCVATQNLRKFQDVFKTVPVCDFNIFPCFEDQKYGCRKENYYKLYSFIDYLIKNKKRKFDDISNHRIIKRNCTLGFEQAERMLQKTDFRW